MTIRAQDQELRVFTTQLFSVDYKNKHEDLSNKDIAKIVFALVIGFFFGVIGSPIAGLATSYILRDRKIQALEEDEIAQWVVKYKIPKMQQAITIYNTSQAEEEYADPLDDFEPEAPA